MKEFNTTAVCIPSKHYMVDISERVKEIKKLVDAGKYFTINRARQYGKTTTLKVLASSLQDAYCVLSLDFQKISSEGFSSESSFVQAFSRMVLLKKKQIDIPSQIESQFADMARRNEGVALLYELFFTISDWCAETDKPIVLMIDEVDSAANN